MQGVKTLTGISNIFTYIVSPLGEVMFRKFPSFCINCSNMAMINCTQKDMVGGKVRVVVEADEVIRKDLDNNCE